MDYHTLSPAVAGMLRQARRRRGLSLREAARLLDSGKGYLSMLESAQRAPSMAMGTEIARVYHLSTQEAGALKAESVPGVGRDKTSRRKAAA